MLLTLDHWSRYLTRVPSTIECPEMRVIGDDHEPPVFVGPGHLDIRSTTAITFTMFATQGGGNSRLKHLARTPEPQFRLVATDYEGTEWTCGWTSPRMKGLPKLGYPLTGELHSLTTKVSGAWVATSGGVELVLPNVVLPMETQLVSVFSFDGEEFQRSSGPGKQSVQALDSEITFFYKPSDDALWVTARTSDKFSHPYAENWLTEPLRILLGQLVYPRLVARNFGNGEAFVSLRPSPPHLYRIGIASLLDEDPLVAGGRFWKLYADLLTMIGDSRDSKGNPDFETHRVTRFYEEVIQATQGSRWVLSMTLASSAEGLAKMLMRPNEKKSDFTEAHLDSLKKHVEQWNVNEMLRDRVLGEIGRAQERTIGRYLRDLVRRGVLDDKNANAWSEVRNAVMHGNLTSPWSTAEEEKRLLDLADLVHRLTRELIREKVA